MSWTYSFKNVNVFLTIGTTISIGAFPVGVPIEISAKNFFGKEGTITVNPYQDSVSGADVSIDGEQLVDISNDRTGSMVVTVGDMSGAHYLFNSIFSFHKQGLLSREIGLNVLQKPFGGTETIFPELLYSGSNGRIRSLPGKGFGTRQSGNSFLFEFETLAGGTSVSGVGDILQYL